MKYIKLTRLLIGWKDTRWPPRNVTGSFCFESGRLIFKCRLTSCSGNRAEDLNLKVLLEDRAMLRSSSSSVGLTWSGEGLWLLGCSEFGAETFRDATSSWVFFFLDEESSSRAMLASFSLMAASRASCLNRGQSDMLLAII
ncbi:hypothetical protein EYF80_036666 [Liparis tanakae]|uniref:Uncharacterized protein n=1 Tax=Liparis tanakae TaxID=230148 RepID=A0A4Z2GHX0_9TELE|nr:hypothetical protein EYF80_036666 [Liparis tanakae]